MRAADCALVILLTPTGTGGRLARRGGSVSRAHKRLVRSSPATGPETRTTAAKRAAIIPVVAAEVTRNSVAAVAVRSTPTGHASAISIAMLPRRKSDDSALRRRLLVAVLIAWRQLSVRPHTTVTDGRTVNIYPIKQPGGDEINGGE